MPQPVYLAEITAMVWPKFLSSGSPGSLGSQVISRNRVAVSSANTYRVTGVARRSSSADGLLTLAVRYYDATGAYLADGLYAASSVTPGTNWTTYSATFGASTANAVPGSAAFMAIIAALQKTSFIVKAGHSFKNGGRSLSNSSISPTLIARRACCAQSL